MLTPPVCQNGGSCYNSYGSFVCRCPPEWTGPTCLEGRSASIGAFQGSRMGGIGVLQTGLDHFLGG